MVLSIALAIFAVYRLATDLAWESGPFGAYEKLRGWVIGRSKAEWLSEGISCPVCWSFWLALPALWWGPLYWLGIAGAVTFLVRVTRSD